MRHILVRYSAPPFSSVPRKDHNDQGGGTVWLAEGLDVVASSNAGPSAPMGPSGEVACLSLGGQIHRLPPPPPPPSPTYTHTHTNTHAAFLSEFLISLQGRMQDFGEEGVGSTWKIDASTTGKGARSARKFLWCAF